MTASGLQELIVSRLVRTHGGAARRWRIALGPITVRDRATHPAINWEVEPRGTSRETSLIQRLLDEVRLDFPFVD